jgi:MFS family permease
MSSFAPLGNPVFRNIWLATVASNFGGIIQSVAAAWLMATISRSETMVGLVYTMSSLPMVFLALVAGTLSDRHSPRTVMLWAQVSMTVASLLLAALTFAGMISPLSLLFFTFVVGCGMALHTPAWQASLPELVRREHIPDAVSLNSMGFNLTRSVAPGLGGLIIVAAGTTSAFFLNAVSYLPLIAVIAGWKPALPAHEPPSGSFLKSMLGGFTYAVSSPRVSRLLVRTLAFGIGAICIQALLPLVVRDLLRGGPVDLGVLLGAYGAGAVIAGLLNHRLRRAFGSETLTRLGFCGFMASALITAVSRDLWLTGAACALGGGCWLMTLTLFNAGVQLATPRYVLARALAIYQICLFGGMALGAGLWGALAEQIGPAHALRCAGLFLLCGALMGLHPRLSIAALTMPGGRPEPQAAPEGN